MAGLKYQKFNMGNFGFLWLKSLEGTLKNHIKTRLKINLVFLLQGGELWNTVYIIF